MKLVRKVSAFSINTAVPVTVDPWYLVAGRSDFSRKHKQTTMFFRSSYPGGFEEVIFLLNQLFYVIVVILCRYKIQDVIAKIAHEYAIGI